ncbi:MAG: glycine cleavage system protein T [Gammaproteobacteria bacterium]|nr:MAG: glycine cleavage system protein T [Gammaproteobacteria bacterium]
MNSNIAESGWLAPLPDLAVIDAGGQDAADFLQAQFCNDVAAVDVSRAQFNGYCSPKGRLLALMHVVALPGGGYRLVLPRSIAEGFLKRLSMFVLRADVVLSMAEESSVVGLFQPLDETADAASVPAPVPLPATPMAVVQELEGAEQPRRQTLRLRNSELDDLPLARYLSIASQDVNAALLDGAARESSLAVLDPARASARLRLSDINAGVPVILPATLERFVPQMVNLDAIDGLSFRKGCYPGQEIVARMQYLGKQKRHAYRFVSRDAVAEDAVPLPGDSLHTVDGTAAAEVIDAERDGAGRLAVFAVVREVQGEDDEISLPELVLAGAPLLSAPLPYAVPAAKASGRARSAAADNA